MRRPNQKGICRPFLFLVCITSLQIGFPSTGYSEQREVFRVCADPNYLPYSNRNGEGFENRLAKLLATELDLPVEYTWFPQRMGFIRNTLRARDPTRGGYKCDVVMGVPKGFELAITTNPYYRSTYALVYVKGRGLDDIQAAQDLIGLDESRKQKLRFGLAERNPGNVWLAQHGLLDRLVVAYPSMLGDPSVHPGELEQKDLLAGRIDLTIVWGPIAGYFAKHERNAQIAVIPLFSEPGIKFDYAISMGVRFGERDWRNEIDALLERNAEKIQAILREYNVPLVAEDGSLLRFSAAD